MIADKIQMIADHPNLQPADICRPVADVCYSPVCYLKSSLPPVPTSPKPLKDLLAARYRNLPPIHWGALAGLGSESVMSMDVDLRCSNVTSAVDTSY